jgi:D-alanyl-D-alanine carboxypeptidase
MMASALMVTLLIGCSDGSDRSKDSTPPSLDPPPAGLVTLAKQLSESNGGRAVILHVASGGGRTWDVATGLADVAAETDASTEEQVEIGSVSKVFLAVTILGLVEQGVIALDDPLTLGSANPGSMR